MTYENESKTPTAIELAAAVDAYRQARLAGLPELKAWSIGFTQLVKPGAGEPERESASRSYCDAIGAATQQHGAAFWQPGPLPQREP